MLDADVVVQIERGGVDPQRAAEPTPRPVENLTEPSEEVQPSCDRVLRSLDPESAFDVEEAAAVEDAQRTDVLRPDLIGPQDQAVFGTQPVQRRHPSIMPGSVASN